MPKVSITSSFVATARCPPDKKKVVYWDNAISGFVLELRANGTGTYALRFIDESGVQRQHRIGALASITLDAARKAARKHRSNVEMGGNPAAEKASRKAIPTYNELADQHYAQTKTYQKRPEHIERILRCHLRPKWGKMRINEIKPQAIALWLAELRDNGLAPATVEKIRVTFHRSFELAAKWQIPGAETNPVRSVSRPKFNNKKEKFLTAEEAGRLVAACEKSSNPLLAPLVKFLLLTGARKMEAMSAKLGAINLEQRVWHIPDSKTGKPRYVPLSQPAIDVLAELPKREGQIYLFENSATGTHLTDVKKAWMTARKKAGLPDLRIHDLRHSAASFMINAGTDLYAVGKVLGHADYQSTMRYSHLTNDTLMKAVEAGAAKMQGGVV